MMNDVQVWEEDGKFYFSDGPITIWTTELVDVDSLEYDDCNGWIYKGAPLDDITICEV